jgi:hypothetical protein
VVGYLGLGLQLMEKTNVITLVHRSNKLRPGSFALRARFMRIFGVLLSFSSFYEKSMQPPDHVRPASPSLVSCQLPAGTTTVPNTCMHPSPSGTKSLVSPARFIVIPRAER